MDFNPNKPMVLATSGDDRAVRIWDLRRVRAPVKMLTGHSHWCSTVRYNPFHDQLLASCGTDGGVNLWRVSSVSSVPLLEVDDMDGR
jgi:WD40 repeat protein